MTSRIQQYFSNLIGSDDSPSDEETMTNQDLDGDDFEDSNPEDNDPLQDHIRARNTSPKYTTPVLIDDERVTNGLGAALSSAPIQTVEFSLEGLGSNEPHINICADSEVLEPNDREVTITLEIESFSDWASESRLEEAAERGREIHDILQLNGSYYIDLSKELENIIETLDMVVFRLDSYDPEEDIAVFSETVRVIAYDYPEIPEKTQ